MFEILPRDWSLWSIFTQKWAFVDMNGGGGSTPPTDNSNPGINRYVTKRDLDFIIWCLCTVVIDRPGRVSGQKYFSAQCPPSPPSPIMHATATLQLARPRPKKTVLTDVTSLVVGCIACRNFHCINGQPLLMVVVWTVDPDIAELHCCTMTPLLGQV